MCGIAGIVDLREQRPVDEALLARMNASQTHRGPDGEGTYVVPGVGLAHRRLSIIDLAGGRQPLFNEDGTVAVTYNGEIYNFEELRARLIEHGHRFSTRSDTEVIVHAWEQWGERCVERFNGMFAFAVWDANRQCLFLGRDRLGIKPLYYAMLADGHVIFASELKALLLHPALPRQIEPTAVEQYFAFGYVPDPNTALRGVRKLPPASTLVLERGAAPAAPRTYWDLSIRPRGDVDPSTVDGELIERLRTAVRRRLIAEVPLGAFLSGGVDSSAVVAMMAGLSDEPVNTCSISFGDPAYNEARYAAIVADHYRTHHRVQQVEADDFSLIDRLASLYDEPFADSSAIPTYRVCELARRHVTVALSGDGGDEGFAGYRRHRWHAYEERVRSRIPGWMRAAVFGPAGALYPKMDWAPKVLRAKSTLQSLGRDSLAAYLHSVSIFPDGPRQALFSERLRADLQGYRAIEVFEEHAARADVEDGVSLVQYLDFKTYLPGDILTKVDRASMAHGLEVRVPLLDHEFVEWVGSLRAGLKLNGREGKYVFKKALEPHLPEEILYRPKMGFAVPLASWFRGPLRRRLREEMLDGPLVQCGLFEPAAVRRMVEQHQSGARDHSPVLWASLMFARFLREAAA